MKKEKTCPECNSKEIEDVDFGFPRDSRCKNCGNIFNSLQKR